MSNFTRSASHQPVIHMVQFNKTVNFKLCILLVYGCIHKTQEITHCCYHLHSFQTLIFAWLAQAFSKIWPFSSAAPNFNQFRLPNPRESVTKCSNDTPKWVDNLDTCETSSNKWYQWLGLFRYLSYIGMSRQEHLSTNSMIHRLTQSRRELVGLTRQIKLLPREKCSKPINALEISFGFLRAYRCMTKSQRKRMKILWRPWLQLR